MVARPPRHTFLVLCIAALAGCASEATTTLAPSPLAGRCDVTLNVSPLMIAAGGGSGTLKVETNRECSWQLGTPPSWIKLTQSGNVQGPAEVTFTADSNRSSSTRRWEVVVADQRAMVTQEAAICSWRFRPAQISVSAV